jgi:tetratricopeptide (TPR) repeat protein
MHKGRIFPAIALAAVMGLGFGKVATAADNRETCKTASGDTAIEACTRATASKKYKARKQRHTLSLLYTNRGVEYAKKKDFDKAIADHDQAIKLDPKNALAYNNRGNVYAAKGDTEHAIADYDMAVKLDAKFAEALYNRGVAKRAKDDWTAGNADIDEARKLQPNIGAAAK